MWDLQIKLRSELETGDIKHALICNVCIVRRGQTVLKYALPEKEEHVLLLRMSPIQRTLYKGFLEMIQDETSDWATTNPIKAFSVCCKVRPAQKMEGCRCN